MHEKTKVNKEIKIKIVNGGKTKKKGGMKRERKKKRR
jgi:hypothetical protein